MSTAAEGAAPEKPSRRATRAKPVALPTITEGEQRRVVSHVGLLSVLKISIAFYLATVVVWIVAFGSLWLVAQSAGIIDNLEDFIADLLAYEEFQFLSVEVLRAVTVIGVVWVTLATTLTMIAAAFYNVFADLLGGVEITIVDEPDENA